MASNSNDNTFIPGQHIMLIGIVWSVSASAGICTSTDCVGTTNSNRIRLNTFELTYTEERLIVERLELTGDVIDQRHS